MASWTDKPLELNSYIEQIPVQAMVNAEMYRQNLYDQNVEKMDAAFQSIADIPVDPKYSDYVHAQLSNLHKGVQQIAGADFSNSQLTRQVLSAARTIGSDPIIQAGVVSAANHKYNLENMRNDQKDGKLDPGNQYDYDKQYAAWKQNPDLSTPFGGNYTTFIDVHGKWMDILKAMTGNSYVEDIPYEVGPDGKPDYEKMAIALAHRGYKGIDPSHLEAAVRSSLTPADLNQLRISGQYQLRSYSPDQLIQLADVRYEQYKTKLLEQKEKLTTDIKMYGEASDLGQKMRKSLDYIDEMLGKDGKAGKLETQRNEEATWIKNDPERARAEIYKNGAIDQFSNAFSWTDSTLEYKTSPFTDYGKWLKEYQLDLDQFEWLKYYQGQQLEIDRAKALKEGKGDGSDGGAGGVSGITTSTAGINTDRVLQKSAVETYTGIAAGYAQTAQDLTDRLVIDLTGPNDDPIAIEASVKSMIAKYQAGDVSNIDPAMQKKLAPILKASTDAATMNKFYDDAKKAIDKKMEKTEGWAQMRAEMSAHNNLRLPDGTNYNPDEIMDFLAEVDKGTSSPTTGGTGGPGISTIDTSKLTPKQKKLYDFMYNVRYSGITTGGRASRTPNQNELLVNSYLNSYSGTFDKYKAIQAEKNNQLEKWISNRVPITNPALTAQVMPKGENRNTMMGNISALLEARRSSKGSNEGLDIDDALEMVSGKGNENTQVSFYRQPGNNQLLLTQAGKDTQVIRLTDEEANQVMPILKYQDKRLSDRLAIGRINTNYLGTPEGAFFQRTDFNSVKNLNVTADLKPADGMYDSNGNPMFYIEYAIQVNGVWRKFSLGSVLTYDQVKANISSVTDEMLMREFSRQYQTGTLGTMAQANLPQTEIPLP